MRLITGGAASAAERLETEIRLHIPFLRVDDIMDTPEEERSGLNRQIYGGRSVGTCAGLKRKAGRLKSEISAVYYAYRNPELKLLPRILIWITIGYALSPIDLIPDFIPVLGYLDDLIILPALVMLTLRLIPDDILTESRRKAEEQPVSLRKKPFFAVIFVLIWIIISGSIIAAIIKAVRK